MLKIEKSGTLRFWGDWFGRPHDNVHTVVWHELSENRCILRFDGGEVCTVIDPVGILSTPAEFHIADAAEIRWEWHLYGEPQTERSRQAIRYRRTDGGVVVKTGPSQPGSSLSPNGFYALEIV